MKRIWTNVAGAWKTVTDAYTKIGGTWKTVTQIYVKDSGTWRKAFGRDEILITSNTQDYNLFTALGSPDYPVWVSVTIDTDVIISSGSTSNAAFDTGAIVAGSRITIINNGHIIGKGGTGGHGASQVYSGQGDCGNTTPATVGTTGGEALNIQVDLTIDNTNGNVFGGGGGGGGNGSGASANQTCLAGGGGGGGAGVGVGGVRGLASGAIVNHHGCAGLAGTGGELGVGGWTGGVDGFFGIQCYAFDPGIYGGDYGAAGDAGNANICANGAAGGAAGKAVDLNGNSITWLGGNNGTQVKGAQT